MQVSLVSRSAAWSFDDPNLVSAAGLLPIVRLAEKVGLRILADQWLSVPTDKGANHGSKVSSLVTEADSSDDMLVLRHGGMKKIFTPIYAPSTLGSFLRSFIVGHVRQLDAIASPFLVALAAEAPNKQGVGFGYWASAASTTSWRPYRLTPPLPWLLPASG